MGFLEDIGVVNLSLHLELKEILGLKKLVAVTFLTFLSLTHCGFPPVLSVRVASNEIYKARNWSVSFLGRKASDIKAGKPALIKIDTLF